MTVEREKRPLPSRREFISLGIGAFVVGSLPLALRRRKRLVRRTVPLMGTVAELGVVHGDERYAQAAMDAAFEELARVESVLTRFRPNSEIGQVNRAAFRVPQTISRETAGVLLESRRWAQASSGAFDPCLARAVSLWNVGHRHQPPTPGEVHRYAGRSLYQALEVDHFEGRDVVLFHEEDMGVDLGGIGKGYGVDRAVGVLRSWGIRNALVNVGGDLYAMGVSEDGDPWKVGIRSPDDPRGVAATLEMSDRAVATSGDYQQYFDYQGRRYHHLLDPRTGAPSLTRLRSVTVAADACMAADAGATTAFVASVERAREVLDRVAPGAEVVYTV